MDAAVGGALREVQSLDRVSEHRVVAEPEVELARVDLGQVGEEGSGQCAAPRGQSGRAPEQGIVAEMGQLVHGSLRNGDASRTTSDTSRLAIQGGQFFRRDARRPQARPGYNP